MEIYAHQFQCAMYQQKIERAVQYLGLKTDLAGRLFGQQSEQYCAHLEEQAALYSEMQWVAQALPLWEKLVRVLKEVNGGENNQKVLQVYEQLAAVQLRA